MHRPRRGGCTGRPGGGVAGHGRGLGHADSRSSRSSRSGGSGAGPGVVLAAASAAGTTGRRGPRPRSGRPLVRRRLRHVTADDGPVRRGWWRQIP
ncbi:hypothetical protein Pd630_LPD09036 (plasmid) [Rhodococcus opacus PD630]|nr:hypothetical protein Pd630_LPD09036 [Rhodococcus opacus PD630]